MSPSASLLDAVTDYARTLEYTGNKGPNGEFIFQKLPWQTRSISHDQSHAQVHMPSSSLADHPTQIPAASSTSPEENESDIEPIVSLKLPEPETSVPGWRPLIVEVESEALAASEYNVGAPSTMVSLIDDGLKTNANPQTGHSPPTERTDSITTSLADLITIQIQAPTTRPPAIVSISAQVADLGLSRALSLISQSQGGKTSAGPPRYILRPLRAVLPCRDHLFLSIESDATSMGNVRSQGLMHIANTSGNWLSAFSHAEIRILDGLSAPFLTAAIDDPIKVLVLTQNESKDQFIFGPTKSYLDLGTAPDLKPQTRALGNIGSIDILESLTVSRSGKKSRGHKIERPSLDELLGATTEPTSMDRRIQVLERKLEELSVCECKCASSSSEQLDRIEVLLKRLEERTSYVEHREWELMTRLRRLEERERNLEERERAVQLLNRSTIQ